MIHFAKLALFASVSLVCVACTPMTASQNADVPSASTTPMQPGSAEPYKALGTEPFWSLQIADSQMTFQPMDGDAVRAAIASARPSFNGWRYSSDTVSVDVTFSPCSDGMSDIVYKDTVTVLVGTTEFRGCGGGAVAPGAALANTAWEIVAVNGREVYNPLGRGPLLVRFGRDRLSAATGCNGIGGQYVSGEGWIYTPMIMATLMACEPRLMEQERSIGAALAGHHSQITGPEGAMILGSGDHDITLVRAGDCPECSEMDGSPAMQSLALAGDWDIRQLDGDFVRSEQPYRLSFADGRVSGFAGCNRFFGEYSMQDGTLNFGAIGATRMACQGAGGKDERYVLDMMRAPLSYHVISADSVILANGSGGLVLHRTTE